MTLRPQSKSQSVAGERSPAAKPSKKVQAVIDRVERECRERTVYMIGPAKAKRLAELVRERKPRRVVECGTAIGYSGLWITSQLQAIGAGELVTIEIDAGRARKAKQNFADAGLADFVEVKTGNACEVVKQVDGPIDFVFIDCGYSNYYPCLKGLEEKLSDGAVVVADNVGIGASGMKGYLDYVRTKYRSHTEWFDLDLTWAKRDAMEITVVRTPSDGADD
jgi:predicted O-methyltransferase YrrM